MTRSLHVAIVYERREDLVSPGDAHGDETRYHWREPEEIEALRAAVEQQGHRVTLVAPLDALIEHRPRPDVVWNLSVRAHSRNRTVLAPALLELLRIPCVGPDATARAITLNKDLLDPVVRSLSVPTPGSLRFAAAADVSEPPWPHSVLKPSCEGNSLGMRVYHREEGVDTLRSAVAALVATFGCPVLCQELIAGREISVGRIGGAVDGESRALEVRVAGGPMGERVIDADAKRRGGLVRVALDPTDPAAAEAIALAAAVAARIGIQDYGTFDFRVDASGRCSLIDVNADAALHPGRTLAQTFSLSGVPYPEMIARIFSASMRRQGIA